MQMNYKHYTEERNVRIPKNVMSYMSAIVWYTKLKFWQIVYLDVTKTYIPVKKKTIQNLFIWKHDESFFFFF